VARAGFLLAWATIRRARDYKVRAISLFGLPVAFLVIALWPGSPGMAVMVPVLLAFAALSGLTALVGSEHAGAGWVWSLAPEGTRPAAVRGAALAVMGALVAPVLLLVGVATLVAWGPLRALGFVAFAAGLSVASLRWWQGHIRDFPCTVPLEEARRQSVGVEALALFLVGGMLTAIDAALNRALGAWTTPLLAAPMLVWGWRGLAARR
jgi:hypothetical protein